MKRLVWLHVERVRIAGRWQGWRAIATDRSSGTVLNVGVERNLHVVASADAEAFQAFHECGETEGAHHIDDVVNGNARRDMEDLGDAPCGCATCTLVSPMAEVVQ